MREGAVFPRGEKNEALAQYFIGESCLRMLSREGGAIGNVTFSPGCRNWRQVHHQGARILMATGGRE